MTARTRVSEALIEADLISVSVNVCITSFSEA